MRLIDEAKFFMQLPFESTFERGTQYALVISCEFPWDAVEKRQFLGFLHRSAASVEVTHVEPAAREHVTPVHGVIWVVSAVFPVLQNEPAASFDDPPGDVCAPDRRFFGRGVSKRLQRVKDVVLA